MRVDDDDVHLFYFHSFIHCSFRLFIHYSLFNLFIHILLLLLFFSSYLHVNDNGNGIVLETYSMGGD